MCAAVLKMVSLKEIFDATGVFNDNLLILLNVFVWMHSFRERMRTRERNAGRRLYY